MIHLLLTSLLLLPLSALAELRMSKPLIEAGISGGSGFTPDYPAAEQGRVRHLVFPVFHLRGRILRSDDEDGSRARILRNATFAIELSASGSFPASSDENRARTGMDDLQWLGELGPRVFANLISDDRRLFRALLAVRGAFSTDFNSGYYRGLTLTPGLTYDRKQLYSPHLTWTVRLSPQFASREMQSYFYEVPEDKQMPGRSRYSAKAGYIGTWLTTALWYERKAYGLFLGGSANFHDGAANQSSPLFKERVTYSGFAGFRWYFYKSDTPGYY